MRRAIKNFLVNKMNRTFERSWWLVNKKILDFRKSSDKKIKILDIGCADFSITDQYLKDVKNYELYAVDYFEKVKRKDVKYKQVNLERGQLPFPDNKFEVVIAGQVIEHVLNKDIFLKECHRVLKKGALFVLPRILLRLIIFLV